MWIELSALGTSSFPISAVAEMLKLNIMEAGIGLIIAATATGVVVQKGVDILIDTIR